MPVFRPITKSSNRLKYTKETITNNFDQCFAQILKARRVECGLSQAKLAESALMGVHHISLLERGLKEPSLEDAFQLAKALELDIGDFVTDVVSLQKKNGNRPSA